jgi:hypothetical protein
VNAIRSECLLEDNILKVPAAKDFSMLPDFRYGSYPRTFLCYHILHMHLFMNIVRFILVLFFRADEYYLKCGL